MNKFNKPFEPITTLVIIYFTLLAVSIAIYALIQVYIDDKSTASSLLGWTATMFATIALLYTFNGWKDQKSSEILSNESKEIFKFVHKNYQCFSSIFKSQSIIDKEQSYQDVRDNYISHLENLNLYNSLIFKMNKKNTVKEFKIYMNMLDKVFKMPEYNEKRLNDNMESIFKISEDFEQKLIDIILHLDD